MTFSRQWFAITTGLVACAVAGRADAQPDPVRVPARASGSDAGAAEPPEAVESEVEAAVATALLERARALTATGAYADAKQLVVEALVRSPQGNSSGAARALLVELNARLGIRDEALAPAGSSPAPTEAFAPVADHGSGVSPLPVAPPPRRVLRLGGGVVAGGVVGGLFFDVVTGVSGTTSDDVLGGVLFGAASGGLAAYALDSAALTAGDHALIDSLAAWGLIGGLTLGLALDPPEGEAYSLNGVLGTVGGFVVGHVAARRTEVSVERMLRVNAYALMGAAAPWIFYGLASDSTTSADEQAFGWVSTAGLVVGAYLGFRRTGHMASDRPAVTTPTAFLQRRQGGAWRVGGIGVSRLLSGRDRTRGATVTVISGSW